MNQLTYGWERVQRRRTSTRFQPARGTGSRSRDGASASTGRTRLPGFVNLVIKDREFSPFLNGDVGGYTTGDYAAGDGTTVNVNGGWGFKVGRGSLGLFGEYRDRNAPNGLGRSVRSSRYRAAIRSTTTVR